MPIIYRIEDSDESAPAGMDATLAGQVTFDGKKTGKVMPGEFQALLIDGEMESLPHPLEWSRLRAHKETYLSASLKGILLRVERRICLGCGRIFDAPRIIFAGVAGCFPALLAALASFALIRFALGKTIGTSVFIAWAVLIAVSLICQLAGALYVRLRFSERQAKVAQLNCPVCGSLKSASVASLAGKRVDIGSEGKWLRVSIAGKA